MSDSGIDDFPAADDLTLYEGMARAAALGLLVAVHAESDAITAACAARAARHGRVGVRDYLASRPVVAELEAIARAILLAEETGCALHVVHVCTGRGVALVAAARARGVDVSCETCPHYLVLTEDDAGAARRGRQVRAAAARRRRERDALWRALGRRQPADGRLRPLARAARAQASEDAFAVWGGISGCQSMLALLLGEAHRARGLPLERIARAVARLRRRAGFGCRQGPRSRSAPTPTSRSSTSQPSPCSRADDLLYRHRLSPFVGRDLRARVVRTLVRGRDRVRRRADRRRRAGGRLRDPRPEEERRHDRCSRSPPARTASAPASRRSARRRHAPRSCGCCRSSRRSSTCAGAASRPGSRSATSISASATRTRRATRRPADPALPRWHQRDGDPAPLRRLLVRQHRRPARRQPLPDRRRGRREPARLGELTLWEGAQDIVFDRA